MDDEYLDRPQSASPNSCCPVPFLSTSPSPGRAPANADSIFSYDPKLLHHGQAVLYTPGVPSLSEAMERDRHLETKVADEEEGGSGGMQFCHEWESLKCWKSSATSCSVCGIMCNPLLTSRLALTGLLAVLLIVMTVLTWVFTSTNVQHSVRSVAAEFRHEMLLRTEDIVDATLQGNNASAVSLARFLSSLSQGNQSSFLGLEDQVRPVLFLVFSVLGKKAQVTFFGKSGLFLSYLAGPSGISLLYANLSYLSPVSSDADISHVMEIPWKEGENLMVSRPWYKWYRQNVDENTGFPVGEAVSLTPFPYWDTEPVKSSLHGQYGATSWGRSLDDSREVLFSFLSSVQQSPSADPFGSISIGVPFANLDSLFDQFDLQGGAIYLAMADGRLVAQTGVSFPPYYNDNATTQVLPFATQSNNSIVAAAADYLTPHLPYILALRNESFTTTNAHLQGIRYMIDSAPLHLSGATLVCVVIIPYKSIWGLTEKWSHTTLAVLVALATCMGLVGCSFVILLTKGVSNEMRLRAALIQQLEETKSAETKSSHKSLVFANMSHDLRTPLAAILGLLDLCLSDASECSELETNLLQMKSCATNLLGILNSILDMSKIEAGKLLLQESEFDLVSALEEVVDTFSVVGLKTGVEVALDLSDGSVEKASCVVGDVGRVKQIMANLLSNGVKFTLEGHVILRAWVKPLGISTMRPQFNYRGSLLSWPWNQLLRSPSRDKEICKLIHGFSEQDHDDNNYIQVEFEVDDTGRGIPKDRWKSVFENFVQIESSGPRNYDGTGLGLGIVRSLVRLMGGDIGIIDKDEPGEPGTRFRFNLIFKCSKQKCKYDPKKGQRQDILLQDRVALQATFGVNSTSASSGWQMNPIETPVLSQGLEESGFISPPIIEGVHVLLAMQGQGGKKVVKKWMERRGLQVWMIGSWEEFAPTVERIKQEIFSERFSTSERFDLISPESHIYDSWVDDLDTNILGSTRTSTNASLHQMLTSDGGSTVHSESAQKLTVHEARAHLLVIVDITMVKVLLETLCSDLEDILLEDDRSASYRVVWLVNANTPSADIQYLRSRTSVCNLILHKPLYASRLHRIWVLLQGLVGNKVREESDGEAPHISPGQHGEKVDLVTANSLYTSLSCMSTFQEMTTLQSKPMTQTNLKAQSSLPTGITSSAPSKLQAGQEVDHARTAEASRYLPSARVELPLLTPTDQAQLCRSSENWSLSRKRSRVDGPRDSQHVLSAMHILVAEDNPILQRLTKTQLVRHGAIVECVDNGAEAARLVLENLYKSKVSSPQENEVVYRSAPQGAIKLKSSQPYDLVLMDCEMPILNGYEATQRIRGEESRYGIRTPVIALTAHAMAQDEKKCIEAGMDFYLTKPLAMDALVKVVTEIMGGRNLGNT